MQLKFGEYPRKDVTVDLVEMVLTRREQMQPLVLSGEVTITFKNQIQKQSINLMADRALVERALENLIKNAIEAENPSGEVRLILLQNEAGLAVLEIHNGGGAVHYRYRETLYHITVLQTRSDSGESSVTIDGVEQHDKAISLVDDRKEHTVEVRIPVAGG